MHNDGNARLVVASEIGGLGNRFKAWASAIHMTPDARVHWPVNEVMPASFSQMFSNNCEIDELPENAEIYRSWRLHLEPEDLLFLYTDGLSEANNAGGEEYGSPRLEEYLADFRGQPARDVVNRVLAEVQSFQAGTPQIDDVTAMAIRFRA